MNATFPLLAEQETIYVSGGWVFLFMGLIFAPLGLLMVVRSIRFVMRGVRIRAMVFEYNEYSTPLVIFIDPSGTERRAELSTTRGGTPVGEYVDIIYEPTHPTEVYDPAMFTLWVVPLSVLFLGATSLIGGILVLLGMLEMSSGP